jgi:hypothetical protein
MMDAAATIGYVASALCRAVIFTAMIADVAWVQLDMRSDPGAAF